VAARSDTVGLLCRSNVAAAAAAAVVVVDVVECVVESSGAAVMRFTSMGLGAEMSSVFFSPFFPRNVDAFCGDVFVDAVGLTLVVWRRGDLGDFEWLERSDSEEPGATSIVCMTFCCDDVDAVVDAVTAALPAPLVVVTAPAD